MRCLNFVTISAIAILIAAGAACNRQASSENASNQSNQGQTFADAQSAATQSLAEFRKLVNDQNYRDLGFESPDEIASATLGAPLQILFVRLDRLREYREGTDVSTLFSQASEMNFPVMANEQVRSSVVVQQVNGKWETGTLGNGALAKLIAAAQKSRTGAEGVSQQALVHVGALGIYFLGERSNDNKWTLTPLTTSAELDLTAERAAPAEQVFTRLAVAARELRDDAPM